MKILAFIADGSEGLEFMGFQTLMKRAGIEVDIMSMSERCDATFSSGVTIKTDFSVSHLLGVNFNEYAGIFLPGGMKGVETFAKNNDLLKLIVNIFTKNKLVAAICAAPLVLDKSGILISKSYTIYDDCKVLMQTGNYKKENVCKDGNVITARSAAYVIPFALECIKYLKGEDESLRVSKQILM